jgi:hypothetical protein
VEVRTKRDNLSAGASSDRDNPNLQVSFQWSCKNNIGTKSRRVDGSLLILESTRVSVIPANVIPYGNLYVFQVTVTSEDGRTATAQSRISVWSCPTDNITVALRQEAKSLMCGVDDVSVGVRTSMTATPREATPTPCFRRISFGHCSGQKLSVKTILVPARSLRACIAMAPVARIRRV